MGGEGGVGAYNGHTHCTHDKRTRRAELKGGKGLLINSMDLAPDQSALNQLWKGRGRALRSEGSEGKLRPRPHGGDRSAPCLIRCNNHRMVVDPLPLTPADGNYLIRTKSGLFWGYIDRVNGHRPVQFNRLQCPMSQ